MDSVLIVFIIILVIGYCFLSLLMFFKRNNAKEIKPEYELNKYLLTKNEHNFYKVLNKITSEDEIICAKVRLADILKPKKRAHFKILFNKVSQKHIDFVICNKATMEIKAGIELDDSSHNKPKTIKRDIFVNEACLNAGFKLHRVKSKRTYNIEILKNLIKGKKDEINTMVRTSESQNNQ